MVKRERRSPEPGEFEDPLSIYEPPVFADEFERSLSQDTVARIEHRPFLSVLEDERIGATMKMMAEKNIACVVVVNSEAKPVGIFSERDVLVRCADNLQAIANRPIGEVMTPKPVVAFRTDSPARVLNLMVREGFRHVPIVDEDGKLVGVVGARRMTAYLQHYFPDVAGA